MDWRKGLKVSLTLIQCIKDILIANIGALAFQKLLAISLLVWGLGSLPSPLPASYSTDSQYTDIKVSSLWKKENQSVIN